jgi:aminomuconate-semialdehyde/2-hydroxymuconate-6-semialdehyde dehydrogenase
VGREEKEQLKSLEQSIGQGKITSVPPFLTTWLSRWKRLYIGGEWRDGASGETFRTTNPATEEELSEICLAKKADIELAVERGRKVFQQGEWSQLPIAERSRVLKQIADVILEHRAPLAVLETLDTGKPIRESYEGDIPRAAHNFHFFSEMTVEEKRAEYQNGNDRHLVLREPLGVVALVTPWNLPLYLESWKLAPALLMGNSVVLKPSELTPLTASYLTELIEPLLPKGVFSLVQGFGEAAAGEYLTSHPDIDAISFTGETSTGRAIMRSASVGPTRVSFELGGKGAAIIFADADLSKAVEESVRGAFRNQGEICLANSRIYVAKERYDEFVKALVQRTEQIVVGDPLDYSTTMGALIGEEHYKKVGQYLKKADFPARIEIGGKRPAHLAKGFYLEPTIITGIDANHAITKEEVFGPIVSVYPFTDESEVVGLVNATPYGLSASVWTSDPARAERVARQLRCGLVWTNCWFVRDLNVPFGGQKRSGLGREGGEYSLNFFSDLKSICFRQD